MVGHPLDFGERAYGLSSSVMKIRTTIRLHRYIDYSWNDLILNRGSLKRVRSIQMTKILLL